MKLKLKSSWEILLVLAIIIIGIIITTLAAMRSKGKIYTQAYANKRTYDQEINVIYNQYLYHQYYATRITLNLQELCPDSLLEIKKLS